jgi:hypothetical protein
MPLRIFDRFDQVIIYGAKGWMGRSSVDHFLHYPGLAEKDALLLVGSKTEIANFSGNEIAVYSAEDARAKIKKNVLFLNSAYLRREKFLKMGLDEYLDQNNRITEFGLFLISSGVVKTYINLSSGVASQGNLNNIDVIADPYARSKIIHEHEIMEECGAASTQLINCRIYSISGKYINEFNNLALSSFIHQSRSYEKNIYVKSPSTLRTFIDSVDLAEVLLNLALKENNLLIDSGGELVTLAELAKTVSKLEIGSRVQLSEDYEKSADYFGKYEEFNEIAQSLDIELKSLREQVIDTTKAF